MKTIKLAMSALSLAVLTACGGGNLADDQFETDSRADAQLVGSGPGSHLLSPDGFVTYFEENQATGELGGILFLDQNSDGWMFITLLENGTSTDDERILVKIEGPGLGTGYMFEIGANLQIQVWNGLGQLIGTFDISGAFQEYIEILENYPITPRLPPLTPIGDLDPLQFNYGTKIITQSATSYGTGDVTPGRQVISNLYRTLQRPGLRRY